MKRSSLSKRFIKLKYLLAIFTLPLAMQALSPLLAFASGTATDGFNLVVSIQNGNQDGNVRQGDKLVISYAVSNNIDDDATVSSLAVIAQQNGTNITASCPKTNIANGSSVTCTSTYTVSKADAQRGNIMGTAQASGNLRPPSGSVMTLLPINSNTSTFAASIATACASNQKGTPPNCTCKQKGLTMPGCYKPCTSVQTGTPPNCTCKTEANKMPDCKDQPKTGTAAGLSGASLPTAAADQGAINTILNVFFSILGGIALLVITIGGLRYILANGDANAVAQAKNTILYALIGLVVAIAGYAIVSFVLRGLS